MAEGRTPIWKDSIQLPFTPPMNDFSAAALSQIRDTVTLSLFDLIRIDDRPSGGYYAGEQCPTPHTPAETELTLGRCRSLLRPWLLVGVQTRTRCARRSGSLAR